jgi:DNA/RNA-binding domain of Phe-tRNA-synthetase-like protein
MTTITREDILKEDYSEAFDQLRKNRMIQSHYKYGWVKATYPTKLADAVKSMEKRIQLYKETGNTEWLVDAANFAMIEFMFPQHPHHSFRATPSSESPGLEGISSKELMESVKGE